MRDRRYNARAESVQYRDTCVLLQAELKPGMEVPEGISLFIVSNVGGTVGHNFFQLREADRMPLAGVETGGKSSHVAFTDDIREGIRVLFDRAVQDSDALLVLPNAKLLRSAGYRAFHAPTGSFDLHLRLVAEEMLEGAEDVSETSRRRLARLFKSNAKRLRP